MCISLGWLFFFFFFFVLIFSLFLKKVVPTSNEVSFCGSHLKPLRVRFMISQTFKTILTRTQTRTLRKHDTHSQSDEGHKDKGEKGDTQTLC